MLQQAPTEDLIRRYAQVRPEVRALILELINRMGAQMFAGLTTTVDALDENQYGDG